jgi:hypothetical protein
MKWTKAEENKLKELYPVNSLPDLMRYFPDRTADSLDKKAYKMGLKKSVKYNPSKGIEEEPEDRVLNLLLKESFPVNIDKIVETAGISERKTLRIINALRVDGYDINEIASGSGNLFGLVRTGAYDPENFYRFQGEIETPVLMTGDWHIKNKYHSRQAFELMLKAVEEYSVASVMIVGDIVQGLGVYRREAMDLLSGDIDSQKDEAIAYLKEFPDCVKTIGIVMGNHESAIKGKHKVGYDVCKAIASGEPRATYYGFVGKVLLDGDWDYTMMHTEGSVGYAVSYKGQRIRDVLVQQPHILHLGHIHQPYDVSRPHISGRASTITSAALKREGGWEMQKGWTSIVGWYILNKWSPTYKNITEFTPRVF